MTIRNTDLFDLYASLRRNIALEGSGILKDIGLGIRQFIILFNLKRKEHMTVGEIVEVAMTDAATVSRSLVQLIKNGYVEKVQCKQDGRVWYVKLTAKGLALVPEMERIYSTIADQCFSILEPSEREDLAKLLGKVVSNLEAKTPQYQLQVEE